jgi:hypothetical protein
MRWSIARHNMAALTGSGVNGVISFCFPLCVVGQGVVSLCLALVVLLVLSLEIMVYCT